MYTRTTAERLHIYDNQGILKEVHDIAPDQLGDNTGHEDEDSESSASIPQEVFDQVRNVYKDVAITQNMKAWRQLQAFWQKAAITSHKKLFLLENYGPRVFIHRMPLRSIEVRVLIY